MKIITMTKPNGETFQVNDYTSRSKGKLQVNTRAGYVETDEEMMLPMGFQVQKDGSIETPLQRQNRLMQKQASAKPKAQTDDSEMMLPVGIQLED